MSGKSKNRSKKKTIRSRLQDHEKQGKKFVPPWIHRSSATGVPINPVSWMNDRLPEMLWAALIFTILPRKKAFSIFRQLAEFIDQFRESARPVYDLTHTGLADLPPEILDPILGFLASKQQAGDVLRPLLLFKDLPARDRWENAINQETTGSDWGALRVAVRGTLDHQSENATDCRWVRVFFRLWTGMLKMPWRDDVLDIIYYPDRGDLRQVRPSIRATEIAITEPEFKNRQWPAKFWAQCLSDTDCFPLMMETKEDSVLENVSVDHVSRLYELLVIHNLATNITTAVDAKHDTVFGAALYSLSVLREIVEFGGNTIQARMGLRSILECLVTLTYLQKKDDPSLWQSHRVFGSGQAKLTFLRVPRFLVRDELNDTGQIAMRKEWYPVLERGT
jgi:hypothetical protein